MSHRNHGAGLSTVKTRVDILGGSISIGTLPGGGKEYLIELPLEWDKIL